MSTQEEHLIRESVKYLTMQCECEFNNDFRKDQAKKYFDSLVKSMVNNTDRPVLPSCITLSP